MTVDSTGFTDLNSWIQKLINEVGGVVITTKTACTLKTVTIIGIRPGEGEPTEVRLYLNSDKSLLDTQPLSGLTATFNYPLENGETYIIGLSSTVGSFFWAADYSPNYVVSGTNMDFIESIRYYTVGGWSANTNQGWSIASITTEVASADNTIFMGCNC